MKKILFAMGMAAFLTACGDAASATDNTPNKNQDNAEVQGDLSSDSEVMAQSSSSRRESIGSSNSADQLSYCKTETEDNCEYGTVIDDRDGNTYKTVKIGSQVWMAENLKFDSDSIKSECYGYQAENCEKYGRYYLWHTAIDRPEKECGHGDTCSLPQGNIQGVCMKGWHLPSKDEWETLLETVGGKLTAGMILKSQSEWYDDKNGVDAFGFSGVPGGRLQDNSYFDNKGFMGEFWSSTEYLGPFTSSTEYQNGGAYVMLLHYNNENAAIIHELKYFGLNVRCVKD